MILTVMASLAFTLLFMGGLRLTWNEALKVGRTEAKKETAGAIKTRAAKFLAWYATATDAERAEWRTGEARAYYSGMIDMKKEL